MQHDKNDYLVIKAIYRRSHICLNSLKSALRIVGFASEVRWPLNQNLVQLLSGLKHGNVENGNRLVAKQ